MTGGAVATQGEGQRGFLPAIYMINLVGGGSERTSKLGDRERCSSVVTAAAAAASKRDGGRMARR